MVTQPDNNDSDDIDIPSFPAPLRPCGKTPPPRLRDSA
jgi:hypothetical protein